MTCRVTRPLPRQAPAGKGGGGPPVATGGRPPPPAPRTPADRPPHPGVFMAIEVRIPTILRTYTGGAKAVEGSGATIAEVIGDLDSRYGGLRDRLQDEGGVRRV